MAWQNIITLNSKSESYSLHYQPDNLQLMCYFSVGHNVHPVWCVSFLPVLPVHADISAYSKELRQIVNMEKLQQT